MSSILDAIHGHRSIRRYHNDPVPDAVLTEILEAGVRASSSGNMQAYSVIVTTDPELKQALYKPHMEQNMVLEAPALITFCADFNRMRQWLALREAPDGFDNLMSFMVGAFDAVLASQNVALAAESKGLGICYMGSTLANCDQIAELLQLPEGVVPVVGFSLGYPAEQPELRDRLPLSGLVHRDTYQQYTDEEILAIYDDRERAGWARYMADPGLRQRVEAAGVTNLAQVYTQVKYSRQSHIDFSQTLLRTLKRQGFFNHHETASTGERDRDD